MNPESGLTNPTESAALTTVLFVVVEVLKYVLKIEGKKGSVQILVLFLAQGMAFGDTFYGTKTAPDVSGFVIWNTFLRGFLLAGAAMGIHNLRSGLEERRALMTGTLRPVGYALDAAQAANSNVADALNQAEHTAGQAASAIGNAQRIGAGIAGNLFEIQRPSSDTPALPAPNRGDSFALNGSNPGPVIPIEQYGIIFSALTTVHQMTAAAASSLMHADPMQARRLAAQAGVPNVLPTIPEQTVFTGAPGEASGFAGPGVTPNITGKNNNIPE